MSVQTLDSLQLTTGLVFPKASGLGVKIATNSPPDPSAAAFGYRDLKGLIVPHVGGGSAPTSTLYRGTGTNIRKYSFAAANVIDQICLHMDHDYAPGTDMFLHLHWLHAGTAISGSFVVNWYLTYAKGYNQAIFPAEINVTQTISTPNIATIPQYSHQIHEFQCTIAGGDSTHIDTNQLEPDGELCISAVITTIPTITGAPGGSVNAPFIDYVDVHYQSTGLHTKNKNQPFYT